MAILDNFENSLDFDIEYPKYENLTNKIFSETVCKDCQHESSDIQITDNMGRPVSWDQTKTN
jgi:hypothetical protein